MARDAVVLDQHPLWLEAVDGVLQRLDVVVKAKTSRYADALDLVREHRPDMFLLEPNDAAASDHGIELIRSACALYPELRVIVLSDACGADAVDAAFAAGAAAYVFKSAHPDDLGSAIRQAFDPSIFLARPSLGSAPRAAVAVVERPADSPSLTKRELEILQLVSEGHSNGELARMLWVTEQTVKFHLSNIYRKLDVANRTEASRWAQTHGLLEHLAGVTAA